MRRSIRISGQGKFLLAEEVKDRPFLVVLVGLSLPSVCETRSFNTRRNLLLESLALRQQPLGAGPERGRSVFWRGTAIKGPLPADYVSARAVGSGAQR